MSETNDTTNGNDDVQVRGASNKKTAKWERRAQHRRTARAHCAPLPELTGCPFADAFLAGLRLTPRLGCGPAHLEGAKLIYDAAQPVWKQLQEIAEQTVKWRDRRGLHVVRAELEHIGVSAEYTTGTSPCRRPRLQLLNGGLHIRAQGRAESGDTVQ